MHDVDRLTMTAAAKEAKAEGKESTSRLEYVNECIRERNSAISVGEDDDNGLSVTSTVPQQSGALVLSCQAAAIALEPCRRNTRCGYCNREVDPTSSKVCSDCEIVAICDACRPVKKGWHESSRECILFQALVQVVGAESLDSSLLLTMRLMFQRWYDSQLDKNKNGAPQATIDWKLFDCLYAMPSTQVQDGDMNDTISLLLSNLRLVVDHLSKDVSTEWLTRESFDQVSGRVIGCSHAITDFLQPLGDQCLGRAIFVQHSFYNHACTPNAFLSCTTKNDTLTARVHLLKPVDKNEPITLSYLPLSGLSKMERQLRLMEGYHFKCSCTTCAHDSYEEYLKLESTADVESLRQVQFTCHADLLRLQNDFVQDDLDSRLGTLQMLQRGLENQNIPASHEVRLELHRLLAMAYTLNEQIQLAMEQHEAFFKALNSIPRLFDPVAEAIQRLEYAKLLQDDSARQQQELSFAVQKATTALGENHEFVQSISERITSSSGIPPFKKRKQSET